MHTFFLSGGFIMMILFVLFIDFRCYVPFVPQLEPAGGSFITELQYLIAKMMWL